MARPSGSKNKVKTATSKPNKSKTTEGDIFAYEIQKDIKGNPITNKYGQKQIEISRYSDEELGLLYEETDESSDINDPAEQESIEKPQVGKKYIESFEDFSLNKKGDILIQDQEMTLSSEFVSTIINEAKRGDKVLALGYDKEQNIILFYLRPDHKGRIDLDDLVEGEDFTISISAFLNKLDEDIDGEYFIEELDNKMKQKMWGIQL